LDRDLDRRDPGRWTGHGLPLDPRTSAKLYAAIDREAQALADGDFSGFLALQMSQDPQTYYQYGEFPAWGHPSPTSDRPLYEIIDYNLRTSTKAWVDTRQYRNGRWFRETRCYQWEKDRWLRSEGDPLFWSGQTETLDTPHFHAIYAVEDRDLARPIVRALEEVYPQVCRDLGCAEAAATLTYTLKLNATTTYGLQLSEDARELIFSSPRLTGVYEDQPLDSSYLVWGITVAAVQRAYYHAASQWNGDAEGHVVFIAIMNWALRQMANEPNRIQDIPAPLNPKELVPLPELWGKAYVYDQNNQVQPRADRNIIYPEGSLVIRFIAQEYGAPAIPKLLKALSTARSFEDMIENGLGVPFAEFDQKWQAWAKANLAQP
jgi:hypothetical protein